MIKNSLCPYCQVKLNTKQNHPYQKTVEHMIPQTVLRTPRGKKQGDFYACRQCNGEKSDLDYILGVIGKGQSDDDELALQTFRNSLEGKRPYKERFRNMINSAKPQADGKIQMDLPILGIEVHSYATFLAKGQYFKLKGKPLSTTKYLIQAEVVGKNVWVYLEKNYLMHNRNLFSDSEKGLREESISSDECLIWSRGKEYVFIFHKRFALKTTLVVNTKRNRRKLEMTIKRFNKPVKGS